MWNPKFMAGVALSVLTMSTQVFADSNRHFDDGYYVKAKVVRVQPIVRVVQVATPREVCWDERVRQVDNGYRAHSDAPVPMIVGGVVGGLVGNQIGKRGQRNALTIAGTIVGATVGHSISHQSRHDHRSGRSYTTIERRCETVTDYYDEERVDGYNVTYKYQGRHFNTRSDGAPGKHIRVWVQVRPTHDYGRVSRNSRRHHRHDHDCDDDCFDT